MEDNYYYKQSTGTAPFREWGIFHRRRNACGSTKAYRNGSLYGRSPGVFFGLWQTVMASRCVFPMKNWWF